MPDALDDVLSQIPVKSFKKPKILLSHLVEAYGVGVPPLMITPMTDLLKEAGGHPFHIGTPDPEMRRIASWILTSFGVQKKQLRSVIDALWKRNGREDLKLVGLLLANVGPDGLDEKPWDVFFELISGNSSLALEVVLEIAEEMSRAGYELPENNILENFSERGKVEHQCAVLILTLRRGIDLPRELICSAPEGGELFERIRSRLLAA